MFEQPDALVVGRALLLAMFEQPDALVVGRALLLAMFERRVAARGRMGNEQGMRSDRQYQQYVTLYRLRVTRPTLGSHPNHPL